MPQTALIDQTTVNTTTAGAQFAPATCALAGGGHVVVWGDYESGHVYGQRYDASGQPVGGQIDIADQRGGSPVHVTYVDNAADVVSEAAGGGTDRVLASVSYTLGAGVHAEQLTTTNNAGTGAINLTGDELANPIYGNAGANVLDGKDGADTLVGLAGADSFAFTTALGGGNVDTISGFSVPDDTIRLENAMFTGLAAGALAAGVFNTGSSATQADARVIYNAATGSCRSTSMAPAARRGCSSPRLPRDSR